MQSFQEILEFRDKNADDEKVTYEYVNIKKTGCTLALDLLFVTIDIVSI